MSDFIETVDLPELVCIGLPIKARLVAVRRALVEAWSKLHAADTGATAFLRISKPATHGVQHEFVGFIAATKTEVPDGMARLVLPAASYLRLRHVTPEAQISEGFKTLQQHAAAKGADVTGLKLDFGYVPGQPDTPHELHLQLAPKPMLLG